MADDDPITILAIDGGGIRGILPARVLEEIERRTGKPAKQLFCLISGTSTGGILACGLAHGVRAKDLVKLYVDKGGTIFHRSFGRKLVTLWGLLGPKYDPAPLESAIRETLGDTAWLSTIAGTELLVPSYCIQLPRPTDLDNDGIKSTRTPMFFKSWKARGVGLAPGETASEFDFPLRHVARATAAAETYFPPARVRNRLDDEYIMTDGGTFANVPGLSAWVGGRQRFPGRKFLIVSLGAGWLEDKIDGRAAGRWGALRWLRPIISILLDGQADTASYILESLLGREVYRFDISLGTDENLPYTVDEEFDDASPDNIRRINALADHLIQQSDAKLEALCRILTGLACPPV